MQNLGQLQQIPNFPNYYINRNGQVWSIPRSKVRGQWLKQCLMGDRVKYLGVQLCKEGKAYSKKIHRLLLEAFVGPCPENMEARHLDGNYLNNSLDNLCWGTHSDNEKDKIKHGTSNCSNQNGENNPSSKLTKKDVRMIIYSYKTGLFSQREIASWYGISQGHVKNIVLKKRWKHIWKS